MAGSAAGTGSIGLFTSFEKSSILPAVRSQVQRQAGNSQGLSDVLHSKKLALITEREGEDAALTGGTRSLHRRLLALNLRELKPVSPAKPEHSSAAATPLSA